MLSCASVHPRMQLSSNKIVATRGHTPELQICRIMLMLHRVRRMKTWSSLATTEPPYLNLQTQHSDADNIDSHSTDRYSTVKLTT